MDLHMEKFDKMLNELRQDKNLELNLSKIIRTIKADFEFQSLGVFLKVPKSGIFRLKIGRNLSHNFEKNTLYRCDDPLICELSSFKPINVKSLTRYKFELDFSNLIILPLFNNYSLLGFLFIDKAIGNFTEDEITRLSVYSSIISMGANLDNLRNYIYHLSDTDEVSKLFHYKSFLKRSETLLAQANRYNRDLSVVALKLNNYKNIVRTIGKENSYDLIRQISDILRRNLRDTDLLGKIFTDTFAILMTETRAEASHTPLNRLNEKISNLPLMAGYHMGWGLIERKDRESTIQEMMRKAEEAAFESNRNGKNNITVCE